MSNPKLDKNSRFVRLCSGAFYPNSEIYLVPRGRDYEAPNSSGKSYVKNRRLVLRPEAHHESEQAVTLSLPASRSLGEGWSKGLCRTPPGNLDARLSHQLTASG
jgi:hypothetical protein